MQATIEQIAKRVGEHPPPNVSDYPDLTNVPLDRRAERLASYLKAHVQSMNTHYIAFAAVVNELFSTKVYTVGTNYASHMSGFLQYLHDRKIRLSRHDVEQALRLHKTYRRFGAEMLRRIGDMGLATMEAMYPYLRESDPESAEAIVSFAEEHDDPDLLPELLEKQFKKPGLVNQLKGSDTTEVICGQAEETKRAKQISMLINLLKKLGGARVHNALGPMMLLRRRQLSVAKETRLVELVNHLAESYNLEPVGQIDELMLVVLEDAKSARI